MNQARNQNKAWQVIKEVGYYLTVLTVGALVIAPVLVLSSIGQPFFGVALSAVVIALVLMIIGRHTEYNDDTFQVIVDPHGRQEPDRIMVLFSAALTAIVVCSLAGIINLMFF